MSRERAGYSSNYKQLELARGKKAVAEEDLEETRSSRIRWYRNGGRYSTTPVGSHGTGMVAGTIQLQ